jgi:hypothetical protein
MQQLTTKRPWIAAVLGALGTGLGHLYLRRWKRALGWAFIVVAITHLFISPAAIEAFVTGSGSLRSMLPLLVVASLSTADAYLLAHAHNAAVRVTVEPDGTLTHCPRCGKELDSNLNFCHWCTARVDRRDGNGVSQTRNWNDVRKDPDE